MYTDIEKKEIKIKMQGERHFSVTFTMAEVEDIFRNYFLANYHTEIGSMDIDVAWENNGDLTINGHQDIKEG